MTQLVKLSEESIYIVERLIEDDVERLGYLPHHFEEILDALHDATPLMGPH